MEQPKIGFIGYGRHAKANLYPVINMLGYKISCIATTRKETAKQAQTDFNIPNVYTDYKEMLTTEKLDCVFIATPMETQFQIAKDSLNAGAHVFVEKFLCTDALQASEIAELSKAKGKIVAVGFMKRFAKASLKLKAIISDKEKFGDILSLSQISTCRSFGATNKDHLLMARIHDVDLLRYFLGDIKEVKGYFSPIDTHLTQTFTGITTDNKVFSVYYTASPSWERPMLQTIVTGTKGYAMIEDQYKVKYHYNGPKLDVPRWQELEEEVTTIDSMTTTHSGGVKDFYQNGFIGEIQNFLYCVVNGGEPINNATEHLKTMELCDMIIDGMKEV